MTRYAVRLRAVQASRNTSLGLTVAARLTTLPLPIQRYDDPFLPYGKAIIGATRDLVCAYVFDLAAYLAIGAAGAVALERTIAYARADGETICILHAPFATDSYVQAMSDAAFAVDAVTLTADAPAEPYLQAGLGVYLTDTRATALLHHPANVDPVEIRLLPESLVTADRGDDFAQTLRAAVEAQS